MTFAGAGPGVEQRTMRKVARRLLPIIVLIYFIAYVDRTNVGFAASGMRRDLGFSNYVYGWGAGIFFLAYALFEVPSNAILHRVGARIWIARIMATWGIASGLTMFVTGPASFLGARFALGAAEAGFFPGALLYFTYWFPAAYRARVVSALFLAVPGSNAAAAAISGAILRLEGTWDLAGWQWLFLIEAVPAVALAPVVLRVLTDRPSDAAWLADEERRWLETQLVSEQRAIEGARNPATLLAGLTDRRVMLLSLVYLTIVSATYGITFFLPLMMKAHGLSDVATGFATAVPYVVGTLGMLLWAASSDRSQERRWHYTIAALVAATGLALAAASQSLAMTIGAMSVAAVGLYGAKPAFWPMPAAFLAGPAAASGIALVNSVGNLGGFFGPWIVGWLRDSTHGEAAALCYLAGCAALSAVIVGVAAGALDRRASREK